MAWFWLTASLAGALSLAGCDTASHTSIGTSNPDASAPPNYVAKISIAGVKPAAQAHIEQYLRDRGYVDVTVSREGDALVLIFETDRDVAAVERDLARLETPTLQYIRRGYVVEYEAVEPSPEPEAPES